MNDINIQHRYEHDNNDGVAIRINLNNPIVKKYLNNNDNDIKSTKSLVFFKELITEALTDIMLESSVKNNKVILNQNEYNNFKKMTTLRNKIITEVEVN